LAVAASLKIVKALGDEGAADSVKPDQAI